MTPNEVAALDRRLDGFLADLTESLGRSERHRWAKVYLQGLLLDGGRKSLEPMAERISGADVQSLRQFVSQSPWTVEQIQQKLAEKVVDLLAEPEVWMAPRPQIRARLQVRLIPLAGQCPWCKTRFKNTS